MQADAAAWRPYVEDPAWLPHTYDANTDAFVFAHLPREKQRQFTFLMDPIIGNTPKSPPIPRKSLPDVPASTQPIHFIFHTGFCCSTLLARALDIPGVSMGVKEPSILYAFAEPALLGGATPAHQAAFPQALDLLARPLAPTETQIVKCTYSDIGLIGPIMACRPEARALVLHGPLDGFLRSIAKRGLRGRAFARQLFERLTPTMGLNTGYSQTDLFRQTDLQVAALAWMTMAARLDAVARHYGPARVRTLSVNDLLSDRFEAISKLNTFFGLAASAEQLREVADGPVFAEHAKGKGRAFDSDARAAEHAALQSAHGQEMEMVLTWAAAVAKHCNAPTALDSSLMRG